MHRRCDGVWRMLRAMPESTQRESILGLKGAHADLSVTNSVYILFVVV